MKSAILNVVVNIVAFTALLFALYLLLKGHIAPGGGFAAGLVMSAALWLRTLTFGFNNTQRFFRYLKPAIPIGLLLALSSGAPAVYFEDPFLTHYHYVISDSFVLSTTLIFDIGVFFVVLGVIASTISSLIEV